MCTQTNLQQLPINTGPARPHTNMAPSQSGGGRRRRLLGLVSWERGGCCHSDSSCYGSHRDNTHTHTHRHRHTHTHTQLPCEKGWMNNSCILNLPLLLCSMTQHSIFTPPLSHTLSLHPSHSHTLSLHPSHSHTLSLHPSHSHTLSLHPSHSHTLPPPLTHSHTLFLHPSHTVTHSPSTPHIIIPTTSHIFSQWVCVQ